MERAINQRNEAMGPISEKYAAHVRSRVLNTARRIGQWARRDYLDGLTHELTDEALRAHFGYHADDELAVDLSAAYWKGAS